METVKMTAAHKSALMSLVRLYPGVETVSHAGVVFFSGVNRKGAKIAVAIYRFYGVEVTINPR
jgi:hypothetical protein